MPPELHVIRKAGRPTGKKTGPKLGAMAIKHLKPGFHRVDHGLYIQVTWRGSRSWIHRFTGPDGKVHDMGLGSCDLVPLASQIDKQTGVVRVKGARDIILDNRRLLAHGVDPLKTKPVVTHPFRDVAMDYINSRTVLAAAGKRWDAKYQKNVRNTLMLYVFPHLGEMDVARIATPDVKACLDTFTATMKSWPVVRGYIEKTLGYAKAMGWRTGENAAAWKENLDAIMADPDTSSVPKPSCRWEEVPDFMATLRQQTGPAALALEFVILCASRTSEVLDAVWDEFDLDAAQPMWIIPGDTPAGPGRMKEGRIHRIPLAPTAVDILRRLPRRGQFVFTTGLGTKLGVNDLRKCLARCMTKHVWRDKDTGKPISVHGFRSSFSTWGTDHQYHFRQVEIALSHTQGTEVEKRYQRSDMVALRAKLMRDWAAYCGG